MGANAAMIEGRGVLRHIRTDDYMDLVREAAVAVESAAAAAEMLSMHHIVQSGAFERIVQFLNEAADVLAKIDTGADAPTTIFPNRAIAEVFIEQHPLGHGQTYVITQDGVGRCSVGIFRLTRYV